jgi:phosphoribosylanthranilate isomerase
MSGPAMKFCGLTTPQALDAAIVARADYAGFVFYPPSPRNLSLGDAATLGARAAGRIGTVGLFVDADDATIADAVTAGRLDAIQLHGAETPERAAKLRAQFGLPVWKALAIAGPGDADRARAYESAVDLVLFDAKTPRASLPGGMGLVFDWSLVAGWKGRTRWGLAGGLTAENVAEALRITGAPLVDTSSGVESAPGVKDVDRIAAFAYAARHS